MWPSRKPGKPVPLDLTRVEIKPYSKDITYNRFDCSVIPINRFLKNKARSCEKRIEQRTFVATLDDSINCIAYYTLQMGSDTVPENLKLSRKDYIQNYTAFPAVNLSYIGVDKPYQGMGLGRLLLQDVFEKTEVISRYCGFYALTLQAYDAEATAFYKFVGFEEYSEGNGQPKMLYPLQNILKLINGE